MAEKRDYALKVTVNGVRYRKVVIDPHYEKRHSGSIDDSLILELVLKLDGGAFLPDTVLASGYEIFVNDPWHFAGRPYRLVWTTHKDRDYIGVINAFRRRNGKKR